jgi:hypothetical protein
MRDEVLSGGRSLRATFFFLIFARTEDDTCLLTLMKRN